MLSSAWAENQHCAVEYFGELKIGGVDLPSRISIIIGGERRRKTKETEGSWRSLYLFI